MTLLGSRTLTVTRFTPGSYDTGDYVDTVDSAFSIEGSAQPDEGRERQLNIEGTRTNQQFRLFSGSELFMSDQSIPRRADRVSIDGRDFEVTEKENWTFDTGGCSHFKYRLEEVGADEVPVAQVDTLTYTGAPLTGDAEFEIEINATFHGYSGSFGETAAQVAAGVAAALDTDPVVSATDDGAGVVTVTALSAGVPFVTTELATDELTLVIATTVGASG